MIILPSTFRINQFLKGRRVAGAAAQEVNRHVKSAMAQWIGGVIRDKFEKLVNETGEECEDTDDTFCPTTLCGGSCF